MGDQNWAGEAEEWFKVKTGCFHLALPSPQQPSCRFSNTTHQSCLSHSLMSPFEQLPAASACQHLFCSRLCLFGISFNKLWSRNKIQNQGKTEQWKRSFNHKNHLMPYNKPKYPKMKNCYHAFKKLQRQGIKYQYAWPVICTQSNLKCSLDIPVQENEK